MASRRLAFFYLILGFCLSSLTAYAQEEEGLNFIENKGQWEEDVRYRAQYVSGHIEITRTGYRVVKGFLPKQESLVELSHIGEQSRHVDAPPPYQYEVYEVELVGISTTYTHKGISEHKTVYNYYRGANPKKWGQGCRSYRSVLLENVYPNIDVQFYYAGGKLKYDFIVKPGGNPNQITLEYLTGNHASISVGEEVKIQFANGSIIENIPQCQQLLPNKVHPKKIACRYELIGKNRIRFNLGKYNENATLIIDPAFIFSTFSGSKGHSLSYCSSFDSKGNFLNGSIVFEPGFPITAGNTDYNPNNRLIGGGGFSYEDVAFMKLSGDGKTNLASTVFGSRLSDRPLSIKETSDGSILIVGKTQAAFDFPGQTQTAIGPTGDFDLFITRLDASGKLIGSIVIGGSGNDIFLDRQILDIQDPPTIHGDVAGLATVFDKDNNIIIASCTTSTDFPTLGTPSQTKNLAGNGTHSGILIKISTDLSTIFYSGYAGGNKATAPYDIEYNPISNRIYVVGATKATTMPNQTNSAFGDIDAYMMEIDNQTTGYNILASRYFGTAGARFDAFYNIDFDKNYFPYVVGTTDGIWPVRNAAYAQNNGKQFIVKYSKDFSSVIYSSTFGPSTPSPTLTISSFLVDRCENVYVAGWGGESFIQSSWLNGLPLKADDGTLRNVFDPTGDYYVVVFEKNMNGLIYGGYLGGFRSYNDHFHYGENKFDDNGILYQTVCVCATLDAPQPNFPVFPNTSHNEIWSLGVGRNRNSPNPIILTSGDAVFCNASFVKIAFDFDGVRSTVLGSVDNQLYSQEVSGCLPIEATLADRSSAKNKGKTFYWFFEDDNTELITTQDNVKHTFQTSGVHRVRLVAEDINSCNERDTSYINVTVKEGIIDLAFQYYPISCNGNKLEFGFDNISRSSVRNMSQTRFIWDFGDGTPKQTTVGTRTLNHAYQNPGEYTVTLEYEDPLFCNSSSSEDNVTGELSTNITQVAATVPPIVCANSLVTYKNASKGYTIYTIDWGDGSRNTLDASEKTIEHTYSTPGTYSIVSTASIPNCNIRHTNTLSIEVLPKPTANFDFNPKGPQPNTAKENTRITFTNLSQGASTYKWDFDDGITSTLKNPSHFFTSTSEHKVKLVATSSGGCSESITKPLLTTFIPKLGVADAFSPNGDGINDEILVNGFGFKNLLWKIYTQRGELVFEYNSTSMPNWNGNDLSGHPLPAAVYTYSLVAEFLNGEKISTSGEITLIR